jgi:hypothetical protein
MALCDYSGPNGVHHVCILLLLFFDIFNVVFLVNGYFVLPFRVQAGRGVIDERNDLG